MAFKMKSSPAKLWPWGKKKKKKLTEKEYMDNFYKFVHTGTSDPSMVDPEAHHFRGDYVYPEHFTGLKGKLRKSETGVFDSAHKEEKWWKVKRGKK